MSVDRRRERLRWTPDGAQPRSCCFGLTSLVSVLASYFRTAATATIVLALGALGAVIARMARPREEIRRTMSQSFRDAWTDLLTGLMNRRAFLEAVEATIASGATAVGILLVDLNRFKQVNDSLGHHAGDELLRIVSLRFVNQLGDRALVRLESVAMSSPSSASGEPALSSSSWAVSSRRSAWPRSPSTV